MKEMAKKRENLKKNRTAKKGEKTEVKEDLMEDLIQVSQKKY